MAVNKWLLFWGVLIILSYLVPYTLLRDVQAWWGAFLFWSVIGLLVIFANHHLTRHWEDGE
ncbi:hypothetical protein [Telmatospirillum sp. J64-1]|uniref:hypothetical protein n=1 Tax=Telmatospirillum sp. J64-1 TaxID=2502183 RepID=UPI00115E7A07|nr:hypothetical protein [Telmatospirillum sp. J64-1]